MKKLNVKKDRKQSRNKNMIKEKYPIRVRGKYGCFQISIGKWGWLNFELLKPFKNKVIFTNKENLIDIKNAFEKAIELMEIREMKGDYKK